MLSKIQSKTSLDWFSFLSIGFLIALTTNRFFMVDFDYWAILGLLFYGYKFYSRKYKIQKNFYLIIIFAISLQFGQVLTNDSIKIPLYTFIGLHIRLFLAYFIIRLLKSDFYHSFVKFVYIMAKISLIFYLDKL